MTDTLLQLSQNKLARTLAERAKLPIPLPERLERLDGATPARVLDDQRVLFGGQGALSQIIARTLIAAGAEPLLAAEALRESFNGPSEAYGRPLRVVHPDDAKQSQPVHAIVLDASGMKSASELRLLYDVLHPWLHALEHNGRVVVLGRPVDAAKSVGEAAAAGALEGFVKSLAKELGGKATTVNALIVEPGSDARLAAPLRFFASRASAFVTGQSLRVSARATGSDDPTSQPLAGKVALVTGAARGIGEATAQVLASEGAHVVCLDRPEDLEPLSAVAASISGSVLGCDVLADGAPNTIAAHLLEKHGGVDVVVHNAGITRDRTLAHMDEARWDQVIGINLDAIVRITSALIDQQVLRDRGRIVSLSSIAGIAGNNGQTNYGASKAGVIGVTRFLAGQLASRGITVNAVAPGFIETRMTAAVPLLVREAGRRLSALGQGGLPEDVARAIAMFATPGASGLTGNVLRVCGGALIGA